MCVLILGLYRYIGIIVFWSIFCYVTLWIIMVCITSIYVLFILFYNIVSINIIITAIFVMVSYSTSVVMINTESSVLLYSKHLKWLLNCRIKKLKNYIITNKQHGTFTLSI